MKKIAVLIVSLLALTAFSIKSMQAPKAGDTQEVILDGPYLTVKNRLEICAYFNKNKIGHIQYKPTENGVWYIPEIKVNSEHRHKSDKRVGFKLFSQCLINICAHNPQKIYWYILRIEEDSPSLEELGQIYMRMISKLTLPPHKLIKDVMYMSLEFDKGNK